MSASPWAILLVGHGSLKRESGQAMFEVVAELRRQGVAPVVEAAFLNFSHPTLAEAVANCVAQGVQEITVQPYFLIAGHYVQSELPHSLAAAASHHPGLQMRIAPILGDHPGLAELVKLRILENTPSNLAVGQTGLLLMAHGTPLSEANGPILDLRARLCREMGFFSVEVGFLECNQPDIPQAISHLFNQGARQVVALPYFLHWGRHVRNDLPNLLETARARYGPDRILAAPHLGRHNLLAQVVADRIHQCKEQNNGWI